MPNELTNSIPLHIRSQINRWSEAQLIWYGFIAFCYPEVLEVANKEGR